MARPRKQDRDDDGATELVATRRPGLAVGRSGLHLSGSILSPTTECSYETPRTPTQRNSSSDPLPRAASTPEGSPRLRTSALDPEKLIPRLHTRDLGALRMLRNDLSDIVRWWPAGSLRELVGVLCSDDWTEEEFAARAIELHARLAPEQPRAEQMRMLEFAARALPRFGTAHWAWVAVSGLLTLYRDYRPRDDEDYAQLSRGDMRTQTVGTLLSLAERNDLEPPVLEPLVRGLFNSMAFLGASDLRRFVRLVDRSVETGSSELRSTVRWVKRTLDMVT